MPKRPKTRFFTIFFNFFHILGYLEGEFSPTGPRNPILGAGFTRGCPGNGLMLKKLKTGQNFTRESDPLRGGGGGGGGKEGEEGSCMGKRGYWGEVFCHLDEGTLH